MHSFYLLCFLSLRSCNPACPYEAKITVTVLLRFSRGAGPCRFSVLNVQYYYQAHGKTILPNQVCSEVIRLFLVVLAIFKNIYFHFAAFLLYYFTFQLICWSQEHCSLDLSSQTVLNKHRSRWSASGKGLNVLKEILLVILQVALFALHQSSPLYSASCFLYEIPGPVSLFTSNFSRQSLRKRYLQSQLHSPYLLP